MSKTLHFFSLFIFIVSVWLIGKALGIPLRGLYIGILFGALTLFIPQQYSKINELIFISIALINLFILGYNTFLGVVYSIPPLISGGENTYEKIIERSIFLAGIEIRLKRNTGFVDNIHVSALINLLFIFYSYFKNWKLLHRFAIVILFFNVNLQFILIYLLWSFFKNKKLQISKNKLLLLLLGGLGIFILIDQLFMSGGYSQQLGATNVNVLIVEFKNYLAYMSAKDWLFGLSVFDEDFYQGDDFGYYVPLTDIGLIGLPIQFGLLGISAIILCYSFWLKFSKRQLRFLLLVCLIMLLHYFTIASFWGIFMIFLLIGFQNNLFAEENA